LVGFPPISRKPGALTAIAAIGMLLLAATGHGIANAQEAGPESLRTLEERIERDRVKAERLAREAEKLRDEIARLRRESIDAAAKAQDLEQELSDIEARLGQLEQEESQKRANLARKRTQMTETLAALQRMAVRPPEAALAQPGEPLDVVRSAMLLRVAVPTIESRAEELRGELAELQEIRDEINERRDQLNAAAKALTTERARLSSLMAEKETLTSKAMERSEAAERRLNKLVSQAENLRDLMDAIEREAAARRDRERIQARGRRIFAQAHRMRALLPTQKPELAESAVMPSAEAVDTDIVASRDDTPRISAPTETQSAALPTARLDRPGNIRSLPQDTSAIMLPPVRGQVAIHFGQPDPATGVTSKGITLRARDGAQVIAPFDGQVAYAGRFRGYGSILILEHAGGYHTLLAGLAEINAVTGQWVLAGEPIGRLADDVGRGPRLYVELRRESQPINPLPWLATTGDKVRG
jgi:septal ring factor EnvC (AmiA/AmiB activator)